MRENEQHEALSMVINSLNGLLEYVVGSVQTLFGQYNVMIFIAASVVILLLTGAVIISGTERE